MHVPHDIPKAEPQSLPPLILIKKKKKIAATTELKYPGHVWEHPHSLQARLELTASWKSSYRYLLLLQRLCPAPFFTGGSGISHLRVTDLPQ